MPGLNSNPPPFFFFFCVQHQIYIFAHLTAISPWMISPIGDDTWSRGMSCRAGPGPAATKHLRACVDVRDVYGLENLAAA